MNSTAFVHGYLLARRHGREFSAREAEGCLRETAGQRVNMQAVDAFCEGSIDGRLGDSFRFDRCKPEVQIRFLWAATANGYVVQTLIGENGIDEYKAGNHRGESQGYVHPDSPNAVPLATMRAFARQTAIEFAGMAGLGAAAVAEDADLERQLVEHFGERAYQESIED